ncbi:nucleoside deaminase [Polaromonas sp.]|uniref:nucleoside deaminase n=1 Tax=Polaromonas sp. TaxID=1869339 RepID=UPI00286A6D43|nr:nucleoside deaminase [Polaromonas sp.]
MTFAPDDTTPMQLAIDASRAALQAGNNPYGAALVSAGGRVLHVAGNTQQTSGDATNHAEMVLLREAESRLGQAALRGSTVYASGEPCAMCSGALYWAGVRRVVYAASNEVMAGLMGADTVLPIRCADLLAAGSPAVQVDGPVLAEAAAQVLREAVALRAGRPLAG